METLVAFQMLRQRLVDVSEVRITKTTMGKKQGERYLVYLPMSRNYLWRLLHDLDAKVRVYIEIPEDILKKVD
jgi:chlorite dismutase